MINDRNANKLDKEYSAKRLNSTDIKSIITAISLRQELGEQIWPGFGEHHIPIIIFNDNYEFIFGIDNLDAPWKRVTDDTIEGTRYYYRPAQDSQEFTVRADGLWAASMTSLDILNREIYLNLRKDLPEPLNRLLPYQLVRFGNDYHVTAIVHESFHAFQADIATVKFIKNQGVYKQEKNYPYNNEKFITAWNKEGAILNQALASQDRQKKIELIAKFLKYRENRRKKADLSNSLIEYEKHLEWLEGTAKYIEMKFYSLVAENNKLTSIDFKNNPSYWNEDFKKLAEELGEKGGHNRFYLSGMAQADLLDQLGTEDWEYLIMEVDIYLGDLLKKEIGNIP